MEALSTMTTWKDKIIYLNKKGLTNLEISEVLNTTTKHIHNLTNAYKIKANRLRIIHVDTELEQFFIGSFLGDGSFRKSSKTKSKNAKFTVGHGEKQTEYLNWKLNFLKEKGIKASIYYHTVKDSRIKKGYYISGFLKTETNPIFNIYDNQYIPKKSIDYNFIKKLDNFGLAVWFMDDGFVTKNSFQISTCGFEIKEIQILQKILLENFNIKSNMVQSKEIYIKAESKDLFIKLIEPYIIPSLKYKLIPYAYRVLNKQGELLEHPNKDNQQPSLDSNIFEGSTTNNRVQTDNAEDSNVDTSTLQSFLNKQKDLDSDYSQIIDKNFWDLV
jgi:hypothetical protein